jgi:hypothetical protein
LLRDNDTDGAITVGVLSRKLRPTESDFQTNAQILHEMCTQLDELLLLFLCCDLSMHSAGTLVVLRDAPHLYCCCSKIIAKQKSPRAF